MWDGCHLGGDKFEIFYASSSVGSCWDVNHEQPTLPATGNKQRLETHYRSTAYIGRLSERCLCLTTQHAIGKPKTATAKAEFIAMAPTCTLIVQSRKCDSRRFVQNTGHLVNAFSPKKGVSTAQNSRTDPKSLYQKVNFLEQVTFACWSSWDGCP